MNTKTPLRNNLVWIDLEFTSLDIDKGSILEIATIVTDDQLNIIAEGLDIVLGQKQDTFSSMDKWCQKYHVESGLWEKVLASDITVKDAEHNTLEFLKQHTLPEQSPLCGNSIWQDRRYIAKYMRKLDAHLHYRNVDVSTVKILAERWFGDNNVFKKPDKTHRALDDIRQSIKELKYYKETVFKKHA